MPSTYTDQVISLERMLRDATCDVLAEEQIWAEFVPVIEEALAKLDAAGASTAPDCPYSLAWERGLVTAGEIARAADALRGKSYEVVVDGKLLEAYDARTGTRTYFKHDEEAS